MPSVRYRYASTEPWIIVEGDRFELNSAPPSCFGTNIQPAVTIDAVMSSIVGGQLVFTPINNSIIIGGYKGSTHNRISIDPTKKYISHQVRLRDGSLAVSDSVFVSNYGSGSQKLWHSATITSFKYYIQNGATTVWIDPATFQNTSQDSCALASCNFKVFLGQQETLSITRPTCPQAEVLGVCPPNTCDVLCGNTICCYNSDGISVSNYPNT